MKSFLPSVLFLALAAAPAAAIAEDSPTPSGAPSETAEAVRVQPRGRSFAPRSAEDDDIQKKLSDFNIAQAILDKMLDKKLIICRRC